jgi:hypothetical protein
VWGAEWATPQARSSGTMLLLFFFVVGWSCSLDEEGRRQEGTTGWS